MVKDVCVWWARLSCRTGTMCRAVLGFWADGPGPRPELSLVNGGQKWPKHVERCSFLQNLKGLQRTTQCLSTADLQSVLIPSYLVGMDSRRGLYATRHQNTVRCVKMALITHDAQSSTALLMTSRKKKMGTDLYFQ